MDGQQIERFYTLGSMYDNGCIGAVANGEHYRVPVQELLKIVNGIEFQEKKKKVHTYLSIEDNAEIEDKEEFLSRGKGGNCES